MSIPNINPGTNPGTNPVTGGGGPSIPNSNSAINKKRVAESELPTTAAAKRTKKINTAVNDVDPSKKAQIYKNFVGEAQKITNLLSFTNSSGSGGADSTPSSGVKEILVNSLTGALVILVRKYGYERVISFIDSFLNEITFKILPETYQQIVEESLISLYIAVSIYGEQNIPISILPEIIYGDSVPEPVVNSVPDLYVKQFFSSDSDPYPGYIQWIGPNDEVVYTLRTETDYPFESLDEELFALAEQGFAKSLEVYFVNENNVINIQIFLALLILFCNIIEERAVESSVGKNGNKFSFGNLIAMLGSIGSNFQNSLTNHIPTSVLDKQKINKLMEKAAKMQGRLNKVIKPSADRSVIKELGNVSNLISSLSSIQNAFISFSGTSLNGLDGPIGDSIENLLNNVNYFNNVIGVDIRNSISNIQTIDIENLNSNFIKISNLIETNENKISKLMEILTSGENI